MGYDDPETTSYAPELAVFCAVMFALSLRMLDAINGSCGNLEKYIANLELGFLKNAGTAYLHYRRFYKFVIVCFLLLAPTAFAAWVAALFYLNATNSESIIAPLAITLVGLGIMCFTLGAMYIKWGRYKSSCLSAVLMGAGGGCFLAYEICCNLINVESKSYFGLSSVFLGANCVVVMMIVYLNSGKGSENFQDIAADAIPIKTQRNVVDMEEEFAAQLRKQQEDRSYTVSQEEISLLYTVTEQESSVLQGGIAREFGKDYTPCQQHGTIALLYALSVGILVVYSLAIYSYTEEYNVGFITLGSTIVTDTILYVFSHVGGSDSVLSLGFLSIIFRMCLFVCGGTYWFYGYCLLYSILGLLSCWYIAAKYFPLLDAIQAAVASRSEGRSEGNSLKDAWKDLMKTPEFALTYSTVLFAGLTIVLVVAEPEGIPLPELASGVKFWAMAIAAAAAVLLSYFFFTIARILVRKRQKVVDPMHTYFFATCLDVFWIHVYLLYAALIIAGLVGYALTDHELYIVLACYLPLIAITVMYLYLYFVANDYRVFKSIRAENEKRKYLREQRRKTLERRTLLASTMKEEPRLRAVDIDRQEGGRERGPEEKPGDDRGREEEKDTDPRNLPQSPKDRSSINLNAQRTLIFPRRAVSSHWDCQMSLGKTRTAIEMTLDEAGSMEELEDWRESHCCCITAFFRCTLHPYDYRIILSILACIVLCILTAVTVQLVDGFDDGWHGLTLGLMLLDSFLVVGPIFKYLRTDLKFGVLQSIMLVVGVGLHIAYGCYYFLAREEGDLDQHSNELWLWFYSVFLPALILVVTGLYKLHDKKWTVTTYPIVCGVLLMLLIGFFAALLYLRYGLVYGVVMFAIVGVLLYISILSHCYSSHNHSLPTALVVSNVIILCLVACAAMVTSWVISNFEPFLGFSITYCLISFTAALYFLYSLVKMCTESNSKPTFFSPYIFPVYSYNPKRHTSVSASFRVVGLYLSLFAVLIWGVLLSVYLSPIYIGISVSALVIVAACYITLYLLAFTPLQLKECRKFIDLKLLSSCWLQAKKRFVENQNAINFDELVSYRELAATHQMVRDRADNEGIDRILLGANKVISTDVSQLSERQQLDLLYDIELLMNNRYMDEVHLLIDFQLLAIISAINSQTSVQMHTYNFVKTKENELQMQGIYIKFGGITDPRVRYQLILAQVKRLPPLQQVRYNELFEEYEAQQERARRENEERERREQEAEEERQRKMLEIQMQKERKKKEQGDQVDLPIDEMLDCEAKYRKILDRFSGDNKLFEDKQFPPTDSSLGDKLKPKKLGWKRVDEGAYLYDKTISAMDVIQGDLGDCYFLSAISVLGEANVRKCIVSSNEEIKSGAVMVKFHKGGEEEEFVIIDNLFPAAQDSWAFVKSANDRELWPMVLEKAYAKLYGSYENIEAGKVQFALSDLTGGAPEQIKIEDVSNNLDEFWDEIFEHFNSGYLMGAGSPEHERGDGAVSDYGIVQGHAYSILELNTFDGERLLRMKNPHGSRGQEWRGDWSDGSPKWSEAAKNKLDYVDKLDGAFWINLEDFVFEFKYIYICRNFDSKWKSEIMPGEWVGESAAGLPSKNNRGAQIEKNPHFALTLTNPCTIFIKLSQKEKVNMLRGKQSIYFLVANNGGERISKISNDITVCSSYPPMDIITVSKETVMDNSYSYPVTLSILVATMRGGEEGRGTFNLKVYSTDPNFKLSPMD